jgi:hypothetical protein
VTRGQSHELVTLAEQKRVRAYNQSADSLLDNDCECCVDFTFGAGVQEIHLYSEHARSILHFARLGRRRRKPWIDKHRNGGVPWADARPLGPLASYAVFSTEIHSTIHVVWQRSVVLEVAVICSIVALLIGALMIGLIEL